jgi:hypothetical protein|tara:strand:+ start:1098 stop:1694 length:597 start_codon:yes stop_codon:yes gene_type:complete
MIIVASLLFGMAYASTFDVYVSPIKFRNRVTNQDIVISHEADAAFYYSSLYARNAKMSNGQGGYEAVDSPRVYGKDTIEYAHPGCNYRREPLGCSIKNGHYYVETIVTFNNDQMVFRTILYNKDGLIINSASRTDEMIVKWIRQQEVTIIENEGRMGKQTMTHYGKEELPLKWEIPYKLLQNHVQQAMLGLWVGIKMD